MGNASHIARKAICVSRDIPRSLSPVIQLSRMDAASVCRSPGGVERGDRATANIIYHKLLKSPHTSILTAFHLNIIYYSPYHLMDRSTRDRAAKKATPATSSRNYRRYPLQNATLSIFQKGERERERERERRGREERRNRCSRARAREITKGNKGNDSIPRGSLHFRTSRGHFYPPSPSSFSSSPTDKKTSPLACRFSDRGAKAAGLFGRIRKK